MTTSPKKPFPSDVLGEDTIPLGALSYFRERFRDRLYNLVLEEFLRQSAETGLTRADVARRIGRRPEQISRWFGAPGNWTIETVSDLLLAIAKSEPEVRLLPLEGRPVRNYRGYISPVLLPKENGSFRQSRSAIEANNPWTRSASLQANDASQMHMSYITADRQRSARQERLI